MYKKAILVLTGYDPMTVTAFELSESDNLLKWNPNDILGIIEENLFTQMPRDNISLTDTEFLIKNAVKIDFIIDENTEYQTFTVPVNLPKYIHDFKPGDRIMFLEERQHYKVMACDSRYLICCRPFFQSGLYTIVDFVDGIRGPNNLTLNSYDYMDKLNCERFLSDLTADKSTLAISERRRIKLNIIKDYGK